MNDLNESEKSENEKPKRNNSTRVWIPIQVTCLVPVEIPFSPSTFEIQDSIHECPVVDGMGNLEAVQAALVASTTSDACQNTLQALIMLVSQLKGKHGISAVYTPYAGIIPEEEL